MKYCFISLLILSVGTINGQDNFKRGYIITNEKDSVAGWIDFRTDVQNMRICKFKTEEAEKVVSYLPGEIYGYRFYQEGKYYISREITINDIPRIVFLEYLVQGIMNLYYYVDVPISGADIVYYFFENETRKMISITKEPDKLITDDRGRLRKHEDFRYAGMIKYLFKDQEFILKEADKLKFEQRYMINIARKYHDEVCTTGEDCIVFETKEDKAYTRFKFSAFGGAQLLSIKHPYHLTQGYTNGVTLAPVVGGRMNISVPRLNDNLSFQADFSIVNSHELNINNKEVNFFFLPLQLGVKYALFGNSKVRPTLGAGITLLSTFEKKQWYNITNMLYVSLGMEYHINKKHSIFFNAEYIENAFKFKDEADSLHEESDKSFFRLIQFKLGYTF